MEAYYQERYDQERWNTRERHLRRRRARRATLEQEEPSQVCSACEMPLAILPCFCNIDMYCNVECQGRHWRAHRGACSWPAYRKQMVEIMVVHGIPKVLEKQIMRFAGIRWH